MEINTVKKRGPKPQGERPMTAAERQRKRREALKAAGGRTFLMEIGDETLKWVEVESQRTGRPVSEILKEVLGLSLDRYGKVVERMVELAHYGASPETLEIFERLHAFPKVPTMQDLFEMTQAQGLVAGGEE